MPKVGSGSL